MIFGGLRNAGRIIAKSSISKHHAIHVESGRIKSDSSLESFAQRQHASGYVPVIAVIIFKRSTMSGSQNKSTRFIRKRIVLLIDKWTERLICNVNTIGIHLEFCARSTVLQIIFIIMLCHVRSFDKWFQRNGIVVIHPKSFPAMHFGV